MRKKFIRFIENLTLLEKEIGDEEDDEETSFGPYLAM